MLEGFWVTALPKLGPWGLLILVVALVVYALISGKLVAKGVADKNYEILEGRVRSAEEREVKWQETAMTWQATAINWQATAHEAVENRDAQLEQGRTMIQLLNSVPRGRRGG
jgi:hypothetical protein